MDVTTGRILTAASAPAFSLSLYNGGSAQDWATVNADRRFPFLSRVVQSALPPGSVMKPLTAAAAMVSGHLDPDATFHCDGYLTQPDEHRCLIYRLYSRGHEDITLKRALAQSCNVYFFSAARRMGFEPLRQWCDKFGLSRKTGIDLPSLSSHSSPPHQLNSATTLAARPVHSNQFPSHWACGSTTRSAVFQHNSKRILRLTGRKVA